MTDAELHLRALTVMLTALDRPSDVDDILQADITLKELYERFAQPPFRFTPDEAEMVLTMTNRMRTPEYRRALQAEIANQVSQSTKPPGPQS